MRLEIPSSQSCERDKKRLKASGQPWGEVLTVAKVTALRIRCESRRIVLVPSERYRETENTWQRRTRAKRSTARCGR